MFGIFLRINEQNEQTLHSNTSCSIQCSLFNVVVFKFASKKIICDISADVYAKELKDFP